MIRHFLDQFGSFWGLHCARANNLLFVFLSPKIPGAMAESFESADKIQPEKIANYDLILSFTTGWWQNIYNLAS